MQTSALQTAMTELAGYTEAKIAILLGVPPFLLGLPSGGDSMTYSNVSSVYDFHWRGGLRPKAQRLMLALSQWLVPSRHRQVEVNRDALHPAWAVRACADLGDPDPHRRDHTRAGPADRALRTDRQHAHDWNRDPLMTQLNDHGPVELRSAAIADVSYPDRTIDLVAMPYNETAIVEYPPNSRDG